MAQLKEVRTMGIDRQNNPFDPKKMQPAKSWYEMAQPCEMVYNDAASVEPTNLVTEGSMDAYSQNDPLSSNIMWILFCSCEGAQRNIGIHHQNNLLAQSLLFIPYRLPQCESLCIPTDLQVKIATEYCCEYCTSIIARRYHLLSYTGKRSVNHPAQGDPFNTSPPL